MKQFRFVLSTFIVSFAGLALPGTEALAQWAANPAINNAICTNYYDQSQVEMVSDGNGGAVICWNDRRNGHNGVYNDEIYAQRISANGTILWTSDGIKVTPATVYSYTNSMCNDGHGGAFISWHDIIDSNSLRVQHVDSSGALMWDTSGVIICSQTLSDGLAPKIVSDGSGGAIIAWSDTRSGASTSAGVYAQRINAAGALQWVSNGITVSDTTGFQGGSMQLASDGSGGAIVVWEDSRTGSTVEIYAQKISGAGDTLWTLHGLKVNSVTGGSLYPQLISDEGGAILCWVDRRNSDWDIYGQKLDAGGNPQWTSNGVAICTASGNQNSPVLTTDGSGGAIVTWNTLGTGIPDPNVSAQRVDASGSTRWTANGVGVCTATGGQGLPQLTSDGSGGAVITWQDARTGNIQDIYAQRIDSSGASEWTNDGVAVSTATFVQRYPIILNDGVGGMIIAWPDLRNDVSGQRNDIYIQRVYNTGTLGGPTAVNENDRTVPATFALDQNYPNPFNPTTSISFSIPSRSFVSLKVVDILGREITTIVSEELTAGRYTKDWNAEGISSGVYYYTLQAGSFTETKTLIVLK